MQNAILYNAGHHSQILILAWDGAFVKCQDTVIWLIEAAKKYGDFSAEIRYNMRHGKSNKDGCSKVAFGVVRDSQADCPAAQERRWSDGHQGADRHQLGCNTQGREEASDDAVLAQCVRDNQLAPLLDAQLRRRCDLREERADRAADSLRLFVRGRADGGYDALPRVARYPGYTRLEKRPGCRGLAVRPVVAEPRERVPEVRRDDGKALLFTSLPSCLPTNS